MEYMSAAVAFPIGYRLVPVKPGEYPHDNGQFWAEADPEEAAARLVELVDDPSKGRELGARAAAHMRRHFSLRAQGARYRLQLEHIAAKRKAAV
jgi:glycosyltransferase involved in cell wall biosynthesis